MTIAIIPAKSYSRRLPNKNFRGFCGLPLYMWSVYHAVNNPLIDEVIVTSDREKISRGVIDAGGYLVRRPKMLCQDRSPTSLVVLHAIWAYNLVFDKSPDTVVLLQPTSPLRTQKLISRCIKRGHAYTAYGMTDRYPRPTGSVYVVPYALLEKTLLFAGFPILDPGAVDIDIQEDWDKAEKIMKERMAGTPLEEYLKCV